MSKWTLNRRRTSIGIGQASIQFVPGDESGRRAYFWIGDRDDKHVGNIDALRFAAWLDDIRGTSPKRARKKVPSAA
jgi:hypothetical protein